jgi:uncharacterized protein YdeI (YjbR/CyaY-like superfamily)
MKESKYLKDILELHPDAEAAFKQLPPKDRQHFHTWVQAVKKPETRIKRTLEAVEKILAWKPDKN